jgi:hypothetical protein
VRPKRFLCLWYVWCKQCTYLALTLTLCPNGLKRDSTRPVTYKFHRVRPKLFMSLRIIPCKPCTYLVSRIALSPNGTTRAPPEPRHLGVPSGASKTIYQPMVRLTQTEHLSCTDTNTVSKQIEMRFHMTHVT